MPRKNRGYKKGEPIRDARLMVIACEGIREKEYFETLIKRPKRLKVEILAPEGEQKGLSHPTQVVDRAKAFTKKYGLNGKDDSIWLVMDVDAQSSEKRVLDKIIHECARRPKWNIALSNPCFEVWLYFHIDDIENLQATSCNEIKGLLHKKRILNDVTVTGYSAKAFVNFAFDALEKAKNADNHLEEDFPDWHRTKVYRLIQYIEEFILEKF